MDRRDKKVILHAGTRTDGDWPPEDAVGYISWVSRKVNEAPMEFRPTVRIELETQDEYGVSMVYMEIYYYRPETDREVLEREADVARKQRAAEARERELLKQLQEKYR